MMCQCRKAVDYQLLAELLAALLVGNWAKHVPFVCREERLFCDGPMFSVLSEKVRVVGEDHDEAWQDSPRKLVGL